MLARLRLLLTLWVPVLARPDDATYLGRPAGLLLHLGALAVTAGALLLVGLWAALAFLLLYGLAWVGGTAWANRVAGQPDQQARLACQRLRLAWDRACARARRGGNWVKERPLFLLLGCPADALGPL